MGKSKKRFIDKKQATTFNVVHRSQQDGAYGLEDRPSERVLLAQPRRGQSEVTALGFRDDGYDYEKHMATGGGGTFVSPDGEVSTAKFLPAGPALPAEALPGAEELERGVEAVTLDADLMDADVRDALFDDAAFEDCEELLDDFVVDASAPDPDAADAFDFDAHVARLIANASGGADHRDLDDDDDGSEVEDFFGGEGPARRGGADVDDAFDAALADYSDSDEEEDEDDEEDDDDEEALKAGVARIALEDGTVLDAMLDETIEARAAASGDASFLDPVPGLGPKPSDQVSDDEPGAADAALDAYYAAEDEADRAKEPEFDCETILTTASTTDNRPRVLDARPPRPPPASRAAQRAERLRLDAVEERDDDLASTLSRAAPARRGETPDEKKKRKAETKAVQRAARAAKKETKLAWKSAAAEAPVKHAAAPSVFSL